MWDAWGGESGVAWAERKLEQIDSGKMRKMKYSIQDEDKHIVTGPAMLANRPIYRFDDKRGAYMVLFTPDTIFKIAKKFARKQHHNNVNENHADIVNGVSMFESYIIDRNRGIMPPKGYEDADDGSWFVSYVVDNDEIWGKVKGGEFTGFSVEGVFDFSTEIPISYIEQEFKSADDILLEKLYSIVSQWDGQ